MFVAMESGTVSDPHDRPIGPDDTKLIVDEVLPGVLRALGIRNNARVVVEVYLREEVIDMVLGRTAPTFRATRFRCPSSDPNPTRPFGPTAKPMRGAPRFRAKPCGAGGG